MKISMNWIRDYVDITEDIGSYVEAMTMSGSNVDSVEVTGAELKNVVVGKIIEINPHPDADKLVVTRVDIGREVLQIVTGAPNIKLNDHIPLALIGAELAGGFKIKKSKLRGVESMGMMCSLDELGLDSDDFQDAPEDGVYVFDDAYLLENDIKLGHDALGLLGLHQTLVEYEITSNRSDCFSVLGIAREAAATLNKKLKYPSFDFKEIKGDQDHKVKVSLLEEDLCYRYMARVIKDVKVTSSPKWFQDKIRSCGLRPINNIVDITNFVLLEMGQPMHAFDLKKISQKEIIVRRAYDGEEIETLDQVNRKLTKDVLVIADKDKPLAIAGIMGGQDSKITEETRDIVFEAASFNATSIRHTSKALGLRSDSSTRFEKHLDPNLVEKALDRACHLVELLGIASITDQVVDIYPHPISDKEIYYNKDSINRLLGTDISDSEMKEIFKRLEFKTFDDNRLLIPSFRRDISIQADLAEEVARIYGYNNLPLALDNGLSTVGLKTREQKIQDKLALLLEFCGYSESMSYSFESPKVFDKLKLAEDDNLRNAMIIKNPLGEDFSLMRTSSYNAMLNSLSNNYNRRNASVKLYEISKIYIASEDLSVEGAQAKLETLPLEKKLVSMGMYGAGDFFDLKGHVETLFAEFAILADYLPSHRPYFHPGRQAKILVDNQIIGYMGEIHPQVASNYNMACRPYMAVLDFDLFTKLAQTEKSFEPLAKYPSIVRDIAILVEKNISAGQIEKLIKENGKNILKSVELFDIYEGEQIEENHKSMAYSLTFRSDERTLKDKEVTKVRDKIVEELEKKLGAILRK